MRVFERANNGLESDWRKSSFWWESKTFEIVESRDSILRKRSIFFETLEQFIYFSLRRYLLGTREGEKMLDFNGVASH